jgi:superfamily I DNA and/or RNA helicase
MELRAYTLSPAKATVQTTIIICTVANIASPELYQVEWFLFDEIPRLVEPQLWPVFAHYPNTSSHIFVGDPHQLPPQLESYSANNCFAPQSRTSLFSRFFHGGHVHYFFDQQHRTVSPIGDLVSAVFYDKKLTNTPSTDIKHESRDIARPIQDFNEQKYRMKSTIVFSDNKNGIAKQNDVGKSSYNISNCAIGLNLAVDLVQAGFDPLKITLLSPYIAQRRYYQAAIDRADTMHPKLGLRKVNVAVIDGYQGKENDIVILDWVVVQSLGFLKEFGRLCVAHSRARDASYVIGNKDELEKNKKSDSRVFKRLLGRSGIGAWKFSLKDTQTSPYVSEKYG